MTRGGFMEPYYSKYNTHTHTHTHRHIDGHGGDRALVTLECQTRVGVDLSGQR